MHKTALKVCGIILGIVTIVLAVLVFDASVGYYESSISYGGDAYTGIQNAAAQTANNVKYVGEMLRLALGSLLMVLGLGIFMGSLCIRTKEKAPAPVPVPAPPVPADWKCAKCSTVNEPDGKFCYACGTPKGI